jgi:Protein of unknown function (DUF416)
MTDMAPFDEELERLARALDELTSRQQAAFFWVVASALSPLYEEFSVQHGRGDPAAVRTALSAVRAAFAAGSGLDDVQAMLDALLVQTPHGDDVDGIDGTYAQDVTICTDAAVRAAAGLEIDGDWMHYVVEPWLATVDEDRPDDEPHPVPYLPRDLMERREIREALAFCRTALERLSNGEELAATADALLPVASSRLLPRR